MKMDATPRPGRLSCSLAYRVCAQGKGQVAMYWTVASASTGTTVTIATQFAQAAISPTRAPWE